MTAAARAPTNTTVSRRWLLDVGPLTCFAALLYCKLVYFSVLLPAQSWEWWLTETDPITGWLRPSIHVLRAAELRPHIFSATLASLILLLTPLLSLPRRWRFPVLLALDLALTTLGMAELVHFRFHGDVMSMSDAALVSQLSLVIPSILRYLRPANALCYADVVAGILLLPLYLRACKQIPDLDACDTRYLRFGLLLSGLLLAIPTVQLSLQDEHGIFAHTTLRIEVASTIGVLPYHLLDAALSLRPGGHNIGPEEFHRVRRFLDDERTKEAIPSDLFGVAQGRNVILISAESLHAFPIGLEIDGQPVAPRLSAWANESLHFVNFHDQTHLGTTSDGEFASLHSLHALSTGVVSIRYSANHYRALPAILLDHDYATLSATAAAGYIWNMNRVHPRYGFERSFFRESYKIQEYFSGLWASDQAFFSQTAPILGTQAEPLLAFLLTSANHHPYRIPEKYRALKLGDLEGTLVADYLHSVHLFDQAFGEFVDSLRESGVLDRSVVVLYGDHQGFLGETPELARLLGFPEWSEYHHFRTRKQVPLLIRLPHGEAAGVRTVAGGHVDITPTILGLLGIQDANSVMLGRDLTRAGPSLVVFRDGSFTDGTHYFLNRFGPTSGSSCYESETGRPFDCRSLESWRRHARERLEISDLIIRGDLIPSLAAGRGTQAGLSEPRGHIETGDLDRAAFSEQLLRGP